MTKLEFKKRWESGADGGGITFNDIAECAIQWGIDNSPRASPMNEVTYNVLKAAKTNDAGEYKAR